MIVLPLTNQQARQLMDMIDLAVKAGGLRTATAALSIATDLEQLLREDEQPNEES